MNREPLSADPRQVDSALRAQLNDISAACQLLQRRAQERDREYLALIYRGTLRAMRILEQRELARRLEDEDELRVVFADLALGDWCRTITSHAGELLASLGITVTFQTELVQLPTLGDRGLLEQLLYALLSNAAKAMDGGGRLSVALGRRGDNAVLTVGDEGRGMSEETLVRLFQDGDGPNLLPGAGAGFGLRLARTIAELHGGLMILENDPGHGVRAAVCLPIREERRMRLESPRPVEHGFDRGLVALADVPSSAYPASAAFDWRISGAVCRPGPPAMRPHPERGGREALSFRQVSGNRNGHLRF